MKLTRIVLAGAIAAGIAAPAVATTQTVSAATTQAYSISDPAYVNAVGHYFTAVEQSGYTAKAWYFHNYAAFKASKGLEWNAGMGTPSNEFPQGPAPAWVQKYGQNNYNWYLSAKLPNVQAPANYAVGDKYVKLAAQAQGYEQKAFAEYVQSVSTKLAESVPQRIAAADSRAKDAYNRLVLGERNYQIYKNDYLAEYTKLNK